jgi:N6-L-threonylcarbamoyladenine synthase
LPAQLAADIAAGFQAAVTDVLADRVSHAMAMMDGKASVLVVAGGVAANQAVRAALETTAVAGGFSLVAPPLRLCTDNAVMVAWAGLERLRLGLADGIEFGPRPRWPLEALAR